MDGQIYYVISSGVASNEIKLAATQGGPAIDLADGLIGDTQIIFPKVAKLRIDLKEDVDLATDGLVNVIAGNNVYLGSEGTLNIDEVSAGGEVRIKVQEGLYDARPHIVDLINIKSGYLILESEDQSIGSETNPLFIDLAPGVSLIARAKENIYIVEKDGDLEIAEVFANGYLDLRADGQQGQPVA